MYQTIDGFLKSWMHESELTQRILDSLTDESLKQSITLEDRTLGRIAWHMVLAVHVMVTRMGLDFEAPAEQAPVPETAQAIAQAYRGVCDSFVNAMKAHWTDESMLVISDMFGQKVTNGFILMIMIRHQIHHRAQMTVLMRQAGVKVPGIYGPAREEWSNIGMEAPSV